MDIVKFSIAPFFLIGFVLFLCFLFLKILFLKYKLHFLLLKELYPLKLKDYHSHWTFSWYNVLDMSTTLGFMIPVYYNKMDKSKYNEKSLDYHQRLQKVNIYYLGILGGFLLLFLLTILLN